MRYISAVATPWQNGQRGLPAPGRAERSDRRRRGYAVRYVGDDVVYDDRPGVSKPLLNPSLTNGGPLDSEQYPVITVQ